MTRDEIAAVLARAQAEIERQDAANERAVCRTPGELAALRRAAAATDALRLRWFGLYVTFCEYAAMIPSGVPAGE